MGKISGPIILFLTVLLASSCFRDHSEVKENFVIEFGTQCGWCAGEEYIEISYSQVEYLREIPCGEDKGITARSKKISSLDWDSLRASFDYDYFLTLDHNECNVCVDGCDEWIKITSNGSSHEIRYAPSLDINGMEEFREKLKEMIVDFNEAN
ncbi:hypothetical protein D1164_06425 [Mariniphaga sediminis]|uniref:Uncharacterized protein n=1 Tax=Mariniphaga sediminis TaxID=1628158 RepID=A0A399D3X8_9BACT|nr:hypothetical protein [Mariniphaga sediminis]RIH65898.1 hypothetical protein D1164_06425 [Mariniphaga sediminis]